MGPSPEGWKKSGAVCLSDLYAAEHPVGISGPSYFLVGFSLGSFLVRQALIDFPEFHYLNLAGVCLIGTGNKSFLELKIAKMIAKARVKNTGMTIPGALWMT